jgi:hypothetical protein
MSFLECERSLAQSQEPAGESECGPDHGGKDARTQCCINITLGDHWPSPRCVPFTSGRTMESVNVRIMITLRCV